jgi:hypothetical protein
MRQRIEKTVETARVLCSYFYSQFQQFAAALGFKRGAPSFIADAVFGLGVSVILEASRACTEGQDRRTASVQEQQDHDEGN